MRGLQNSGSISDIQLHRILKLSKAWKCYTNTELIPRTHKNSLSPQISLNKHTTILWHFPAPQIKYTWKHDTRYSHAKTRMTNNNISTGDFNKIKKHPSKNTNKTRFANFFEIFRHSTTSWCQIRTQDKHSVVCCFSVRWWEGQNNGSPFSSR